jgi:hypothetical protein
MVKELVRRILNLEVGERVFVDSCYTQRVMWMLKAQALGGRRYQMYQSPDRFEDYVVRLSDEPTAQDRREFFTAQMAAEQMKAQIRASDVVEDTTAPVRLAGSTERRPRKSFKYRLNTFLLKLPCFKEVPDAD